MLRQLHDAFLTDGGSMFCAALYGIIEARDDGAFAFRFAAGGHPLPIHAASTGDAVMPGRHGTILGLIPDVELHEDVIALHPGDWLLLYTDGLTDLRVPAGLDDAQLVRVVEAAIGASGNGGGAGDALRRIEADSERRSSQVPHKDDTALLMLHLTTDHDGGSR